MAFLSLNGIDVPVAWASAERTRVYVGSVDTRGLGGDVQRSQRTAKREWQFTTTPLPQSEVRAWVGLIEGAGHSWAFDTHATSSRGRPVVASHSYNFQASAYTGDTGVKLPPLLNMTGYGRFLTWELGMADMPEWTWVAMTPLPKYQWGSRALRSDGVMFDNGTVAPWRNRNMRQDFNASLEFSLLRLQTSEFAGPGWSANTSMYAGAVHYENGWVWECMDDFGTTGATKPAFSTVYESITLDNGLRWRNVGATSIRISDMALVPYLMPVAWAAPLAAWHNANPWSPLPRVHASGTFTSDARVVVRGDVTGADSVRYQEGGASVVGERLTFTLREV